MSLCRFLSLVLILVLAPVVSACASSPDTPFTEGGGTATRNARGSSTLIVRAQLEQLAGRSAWDAVERFNRRWLNARRGGVYARVVIDGTSRRDINVLSQMSTDGVESLRFLSSGEATTKYGTGFPGGVIEVTTRGR